jgi:large subunit ribosomal protein L14e
MNDKSAVIRRWNVMPAIDVGRVCVKLLGRESGKKCIVVDIVDKNFVLITGPKQLNGVKRRRVNVSHIEPTEKKVDIKRGESDEELMKALDEATQSLLKETVKP